jgi:hypothetical protein
MKKLAALLVLLCVACVAHAQEAAADTAEKRVSLGEAARRRSKPLCGLLPCAERLKLRSPTCV